MTKKGEDLPWSSIWEDVPEILTDEWADQLVDDDTNLSSEDTDSDWWGDGDEEVGDVHQDGVVFVVVDVMVWLVDVTHI